METAVVIAGLILILAYVRSEHEKRHFTVDTYTIRSEKVKEAKTLVFLSDLHGNHYGGNQEELLAAIQQINPDAILIGGDMMVTGKRETDIDIETALLLLKSLAVQYPVFHGHGNHENRLDWNRSKYGDIYDRYRQELEAAGVVFVSGKQKAGLGDDVAMAGLDIEQEYYKKVAPKQMEVSYIQDEIDSADGHKFQILLAHSPLFFDTYAQWGADLALAGHFHGGTIRFPWLGGLMTPQFHFFHPYCGGMFEKSGRYMIVSRGLGTHSVNIRLNNRGQVVTVKLEPKLEA